MTLFEVQSLSVTRDGLRIDRLRPARRARLGLAHVEQGRTVFAGPSTLQFAHLALGIGRRAYVLRRGRIVHSGDCATLRADPQLLQRLYLGDDESVAAA